MANILFKYLLLKKPSIMKKFTLFCLLSIFCFIIGRAQNQVGEAPLPLKFGGFGATITGIESYNPIGLDLGKSTSTYLLGDHYLSRGNGWGMVNETEKIRVQAGAWNGSEWIVFVDIVPKTGSIYARGYYAVKPLSGTARKIGNGIGSSSVKPNDMAWDPIEKKMYAITENCLYQMSVEDSTITFIDSLRIENMGKFSTIKEKVNTLACNSKGDLFVINTKNELLKLDKVNGRCVLIGSTGVAVSTNNASLQSACFDLRTDRLYWAAYNKNTIYEVDTLSAKASKLCDFKVNRTTGLFVHYYTKNVPPGNVSNMTTTVDSNDVLKVSIRANAPLHNFNEESQTQLKQVFLYRAEVEQPWEKIDSMTITTPGQSFELNSLLEKPGVYRFGLRTQSQEGWVSANTIENKTYCYHLTLPYKTDFEDGQFNTPITVEAAPGWVIVDSNALLGKKAYFNQGQDKSILKINGINVKKGAAYQFIFNARLSNRTTAGNIIYKIVNISRFARIAAGNTYTQTTVDYLAINNETIDISFQGVSGNPFFIDGIEFKKVSSEKVPDTLNLKSFAPANKGETAVNFKFLTPSKDANGAPLENLRGIIVEYSQTSNFTGKISRDTLPVTKIGVLDSVKLSLPNIGFWYFKLTPYNTYGESPYTTSSGKSLWIGVDTVPDYPRNTTHTSLPQGRIKLSWSAVTCGKNLGYLDGTITGYEVVMQPGHTNVKPEEIITTIVTTTEYTSSALPMGAYKFKISAIRNHLNRGTAQIEGAFASGNNSHIVLNADRSLSTITLPFCVNTDGETQSSIVQISYPTEEMQGPRVIDSLFFFATATKKGTIPIKIYLDYKRDTSIMLNNENWTSFRQKSTTLVFHDSISFSPNSQKIAIPIRPYFYDGSDALLITMIKPMSKSSGRVLCYGSELKNNRALTKFEASTIKNPTDFDTLRDVQDINPYKTILKKLPGLIISEPSNLATISGNVVSKRDLKAISATIYVQPKDTGKVGLDINYDFENDEKGDFNFSKLVPNTYLVRVGAPGYIDSTFELKAEDAEIYHCNIVLDEANKVKLCGKVVDVLGEIIAGADVKLEGTLKYQTTSNEQGYFEFNDIYNNTSYNLIISKFKYANHKKEITIANEDKDLQNVILDLQSAPASFLIAKPNKDDVELSWQRPYIAQGDSMMAYWCNDSSFNSFSAKGLKILGAARYTPQDMINKGIKGKKLQSITVKLTDYWADYTLRVFQGANAQNEIWSKHIGTGREGRWFTFDLSELLAIDYDQDLLIGIEAADGYKEFPIPIDEGPRVDTLKNMVRYNGKWLDIMGLNTNFNYNISIKGLFVTPIENTPTLGYKIVRGTAQTQDQVNTWETITSENAKAENYTDKTWKNLPMGYYQYAVIADFGNSILTSPTFSNIVAKDMDFELKIQLAPTPTPLDSIYVFVRQVDGNNIYSQYGSSGTTLKFEKIARGLYNITTSLPFYESFNTDVNLVKDTTLLIGEMKAYYTDPYIVNYSIRKNEVVLNWSVGDSNSFYDTFENYPDFSIKNFGPYILSTPTIKGGVRNFSWPNANQAQSWMVFNPEKTQPSMTSMASWIPAAGKKYLLAMYTSKAKSRDQIILPVKSNKTAQFSFLVSGIGVLEEPEIMQVVYSSSDTSYNSFKPLNKEEEIQVGWVQRNYFVPQNTKYVAIRYLSMDKLALLIDELKYTIEGEGNPSSFELFLDGNLVATVDGKVNTYSFTITEGRHKLGVRANYLSTFSKTAEVEINYIQNFDTELSKKITLSPNPSPSGIYNVHVYENVELEVMSTRGQTLKVYTLPKGDHTIDLNNQPNGIYLFKFSNNNCNYNMKVVK